jgi:hypothetical protein
MDSLRSNYRDNPRLFLGAAFGIGLAVGLAAMARRTGRDPDVDFADYEVLGAETFAVGPPPGWKPNGHAQPNGQVRPNGHNGHGTVARAKHELGETWAAIADGLVRAASAKAVQYLSEVVPGFGEQVEGPYARFTHEGVKK